MTDTNPDPVKALLEACEPLSALVADYEAAGIDTDDVILCGRTSWNAQPDEPEPPRILFRDLRALSRAASVLRERGEPSAHQRCIDELVRGFNTAIGTLEASGNAFSAQNGRMNRDAALSLLNAADDGPHEAILSGPIGEDQSDLVKRLLLIASVIDTELPAVKSDALREAAAHISRTSASAGREWLPIESAPEDGTEIILWWPRHALDDEDNSTDEIVGGACAISSWVDGWYEPEYISGHGLHMDDDWCYAAEPTHWMPLPKAPVLALFPAPGKETT